MGERGKVQVEELVRSVTKMMMTTEFIIGFCGNTVFGDHRESAEIRSVQSCE